MTDNGLSTERYAFPIIRLADLYLMYAEALNETLSSPNSDVYTYIDLVRKRAGLDGVKNPGKIFQSILKNQTRKQVCVKSFVWNV